jgi:hypothetical protein
MIGHRNLYTLPLRSVQVHNSRTIHAHEGFFLTPCDNSLSLMKTLPSPDAKAAIVMLQHFAR